MSKSMILNKSDNILGKEESDVDLQAQSDLWGEFSNCLLESKLFQKEIENEKQIFADAIINVEQLIGKEYASLRQSIDRIIQKFIVFLQYAVKQPKNKDTIITLLKIMSKIIEKEDDVKKKAEL